MIGYENPEGTADVVCTGTGGRGLMGLGFRFKKVLLAGSCGTFKP